MKKGILGILCLFLATWSQADAQNRFDALRFTTQNPTADAANAAAGGASVANFFGYGSIFQNPASLALADQSNVFLGLGIRDVSESATYLNTRRGYDDTQTAFSDVGFVYVFPTVQGSLVLGAGYNQLTHFNRAYRASAFNERSSITDYFFDNDFYFQTAFNAFAIEEDDFGLFPIFRLGLDDESFLGIQQTFNVTERGQLGEFTASLASEVVENLFVGASIGIPVGNYSYTRNFVERDVNFSYGPIETEINGNPFTIPAPDRVENVDRIDADITGFSARFGMIYRPIDNFSFGLSFTMPTRYNIDESYSVIIETIYEIAGRESDEFTGTNSYQIRTPSRLAFGLATHDLPVNLSFSAERVNYSRLQFRDLGDLGFEVEENDRIRDDFKDVFNFRLGATVDIHDTIRPSFGYAFMPAVSRDSENDVQIITGGLRIGVNQNFAIDLGVQYMFFDDEQVVYDFFDYQRADGRFTTENISSSVEKFNIMAGVSIRF